MNQLALLEVFTATCRLAKRFSIVVSGNKHILLKKFSVFMCIWPSMGNNPVKIYITGSAACVGRDRTCFTFFQKYVKSINMFLLWQDNF